MEEEGKERRGPGWGMFGLGIGRAKGIKRNDDGADD
jgi:hypothetical protein